MRLHGCGECGSDRVSHVLTPKRVSSQCLACGKVWSSDYEHLGARFLIRRAEYQVERYGMDIRGFHCRPQTTLQLELVSVDQESLDYVRRILYRGACRLVMTDGNE